MMNRSIVTTDVAVCFTTLSILFGTGGDNAGEAAGRVTAGIFLVAVGMIARPQTFPNVTEWESPALGKLLYVTELVGQQLRIESRRRRKKAGASQRNCGNCGLTEHPATDAEREAATTAAHRGKLGPPVRYSFREMHR